MLWFSANYLERYWYWMEWQSETQGYLCLSNSPKVLINRSADSFYRSQTGSACRNKHVFLFLTSPSIKSKSESIMLWAKSYNNHTWFKNNLAFIFFHFLKIILITISLSKEGQWRKLGHVGCHPLPAIICLFPNCSPQEIQRFTTEIQNQGS